MRFSQHIAKHIQEVYFGDNWTGVSLRDVLPRIKWDQATQEVYGLNSIATLLYHMHYYLRAFSKVLEGGPLESEDELSFIHPVIESEQDWNNWLGEIEKEAKHFIALVEKLPDSQWDKDFTEPGLGSYFRKIVGFSEHFHYHLGQMKMLHMILLDTSKNGKS